MITFTTREVQALRDDPDVERTEACPLCDPAVVVQVGLCTPRRCACGNLWMPWQPDGNAAPSVVVDEPPAVNLTSAVAVGERRRRDGTFWRVADLDRAGRVRRRT